MKKFLRSYFINTVSLVVLSQIFPAFHLHGYFKEILVVGLALTILNSLIKPLLKAIFLPINLLTLGTLRWIINVLILYLLVLVSPQVRISSFNFKGINFKGIIIPPFTLPSWLSLILASFLLTLIIKIIRKIIKKPNSDA